MCSLATTLTPLQWQLFWRTYTTLFGANALPMHLLSFFSEILNQNKILAKNFEYNSDFELFLIDSNIENSNNFKLSSSFLIKKIQSMCI